MCLFVNILLGYIVLILMTVIPLLLIIFLNHIILLFLTLAMRTHFLLFLLFSLISKQLKHTWPLLPSNFSFPMNHRSHHQLAILIGTPHNRYFEIQYKLSDNFKIFNKINLIQPPLLLVVLINLYISCSNWCT